MGRLDRDTVAAPACGRWEMIHADLAPELGPALARVGRHVPCPVHGGTDGFRLFKDVAETGGGICNTCGTFANGFDLLMWLHGWDFATALRAVARSLGLESGWVIPFPVHAARPPRRHEESPDARAWLESLWAETTEDRGRGAAYFRSRGLSGAVPEAIRLHPRLVYRDERERYVGRFPAMVARVERLNGEMVAAHRTYLSTSGAGKAPLNPAKKLTPAVRDGACMGAAIRLAEPVVGGRLALAEGIETALSVQEATGTPTWATVSAGGLEAIEVPAVVPVIEIWADLDLNGAGQRAAEKAARRLRRAGHAVAVILPPAEPVSVDWNDVLVSHGSDALRHASPAVAGTAGRGRRA